MTSILEMFPDKVIPEPNSGCWLWEGTVAESKGTAGYGRFSYRGKSRVAHRTSYQMSCGEIPDGLFCLHKCDNSLCVNPDHLEVGTQSKNIRDAYARGRIGVSERHPKAKLSDEAVREILGPKGRAPDYHNRRMAEKYGVSIGAIEKIRCRQNWRYFHG